LFRFEAEFGERYANFTNAWNATRLREAAMHAIDRRMAPPANATPLERWRANAQRQAVKSATDVGLWFLNHLDLERIATSLGEALGAATLEREAASDSLDARRGEAAESSGSRGRLPSTRVEEKASSNVAPSTGSTASAWTWKQLKDATSDMPRSAGGAGASCRCNVSKGLKRARAKKPSGEQGRGERLLFAADHDAVLDVGGARVAVEAVDLHEDLCGYQRSKAAPL